MDLKSNSNERAIVSIAVLQSLFTSGESKGNLELLVPFVANLALSKGIDNLDPTGTHKLCIEFEKRYGLRVSTQSMETILRYANHQKLISRKGKRSFSPNANEISKLKFDEKYKEMQYEWKELIASFCSFCTNYGRSLTEKQADAAFLSFLKSHDADILIAKDDSSVLPEFENENQFAFLANSFVIHLSKQESEARAFNYVVQLASGYALASTIMNWNIDDFAGHLGSVDIYLDTPIILVILGFTTIPERIDSARELIMLLKDLKATILVSEQVIEESVAIIDNTKCWINNPNYMQEKASQTAQYVIESGLSSAAVEEKIQGIDQFLTDRGIQRVEDYKWDERENWNINPEKLQNMIHDVYKNNDKFFNEDEKRKTIQIDTRSIAMIHHLRNGKRPFLLSDAKCVFITSNAALARVSSEYEREIEGFEKRTIPSCMTDRMIGTLAWVESPKNGHIMNVRRTIAEALAAITPTKSLLSQFHSEIETLRAKGEITESHYRALIHDPVVSKILADKTLNDSTVYGNKTTEEIIEAYEEEINKKSSELLDKKQQRIDELSDDIQERDQHGDRVAKFISNIFAGIVFAAVLGLTIWAFFNNEMFIFIISLFFFIFGGSFLLFVKRIRINLYRKIKKVIYGY